jgi:predicted ATPase/DNA-binding winged helix-turn-helix (wHTH) protein
LRYRFEDFELLPQERRLLAGDAPVSIGARAFDVLLTLVAHHDRVVTKGELLERVWPGLMVEENNLQVQVSSLRRVLGPQAIATIPGRGYRLAMRVRSDGVDAATEAHGAETERGAHSADAPPGRPAPAAQTRRRSNLPVSLPPLYGRDAELAQLRALLDTHRTVALVAAGGVGKTHLARAVADARRAMHPDGVWAVDLAELTRGDLVAPALLQALGFQVAPGQTPLGTAVDVLRSQDALLLLDNCEHVLEAVASLVQAVNDAAPRVRVLVTSQAPLRCTHERVFRLGTLSLPSSPALDAVQRSGAVQLLVHRIQAAAPHFELTEANAARVAALCQRLDGIALALELAAARVPLLGLDGLLARLDERFEVLTGGSRLKLKRHQTLRAALAFSHGLLTADEQAVFRRLGAFAGSFSAECAQDVAAGESIHRWAVLDHLGALVDKSFVLADAGDPPRLRLLETTRAYALESLAQAGETAAVLERHARVFGRLLEAAAQDYWLLSDAAMLERYWPDQANLRAAMDWALAHDPELAVRMVGDAGPLWREALSQQPEGARYCAAALACVGERTPLQAHGRAGLRGRHAARHGQPAGCAAHPRHLPGLLPWQPGDCPSLPLGRRRCSRGAGPRRAADRPLRPRQPIRSDRRLPGRPGAALAGSGDAAGLRAGGVERVRRGCRGAGGTERQGAGHAGTGRECRCSPGRRLDGGRGGTGDRGGVRAGAGTGRGLNASPPTSGRLTPDGGCMPASRVESCTRRLRSLDRLER